VIAIGLVMPTVLSENSSTSDAVYSHLSSINRHDSWVVQSWNDETIGAVIPSTGGSLESVFSDPVCSHSPSINGLDSWIDRCRY
jgi:hypothetical protein